MLSTENAVYDKNGRMLFDHIGPDAASLKPRCLKCGRLPGEKCNGAGLVNGIVCYRLIEDVTYGAPAPLVIEPAPIAAEPAPAAPVPITVPDPVAPAAMDKRNAKAMGFTGGECTSCHGFQVVKNGTCDLCLECGSTTGCS